MKRIVRNMLIGFFAVSILLTAITTITYINMSDLVNRENENSRSLNILRTIEEIQFNCLGIESGMRGYLIVGDTSYLKPYNKGELYLNKNTNLLIQYSKDIPLLTIEANELKNYTTLLLDIANILVLDEYNNNTDSVKRIKMIYQTKRYMDGIRKITSDIEERERIILKNTNLSNIEKAKSTKYGYFATAALAIIILVIVFFIVRNELLKRKIAEDKLLESSKKIFDLYNNAPCGYHSVNSSNIIIDINDTELNWLGYTREEVIGVKSIFELIHEIDHFKIHDFIKKVKNEKIILAKDLELCYLRKDGSCFDVMLNSTVNYDKYGKKSITRTAVLDITELKKSQEKINFLNVELENNYQQLLIANAELESFSYSVSHDLRAPLRAIDGYSRIILEDYYDSLDDEAKRVFNVILSNSKKMGILIDDLLDFSKVGRKETNTLLLDHHKVIDEILTELKPNGKYKIVVDELHKSMVDRNLIKQVWYNLINNAIKYAANIPEPFIHIYSYIVENEMVYCVEDNGVGFDDNYKHKLFNVFQRLHNDEEFEGSGVGLAIVYKIINKHNGKVWASSIPTEHTKFYFSIPIE